MPSMTLPRSVPSGLTGAQQPRIASWPEYASSSGVEAVELARMAGLVLDPWQELVLKHSLGEKSDGTWASFEVGIVVARQNGKDAILEARELAGLFLLGERLLIHSAHQFDTSLEHFRRLLYLVESTPDFDRRVRRVSRSHGEEGIELKGGQRIRFRTRTKGGGRGFSGDFLALNEAMALPESAIGALLPTLSARPNPQVWYTASAVDQLVHEDGLVLSRVRDRGVKGGSALSYFEWSVPGDNPDDVDPDTARDPEMWAHANPGLGIRIALEHVENERQSMDKRTFAVERLGVGDWPDPDGTGAQVIDPEKWAAAADPGSQALDPVWFSFDVMPDRSSASIGVAGARDDGTRHIEVVDRKRGTGWVVDRVCQLLKTHTSAGVVCDGRGPGGSLVAELEERGIVVLTVTATEHAQGCGMLVDGVYQGTVRHLGASELTSAVRGATKRPLGDSWAWSRKSSTVDISPLVAVTLALWAHETSSSGGGVVFA